MIKRQTHSLLTTLGRLFKFDALYLAKGGFWIAFDIITATLLSFITTYFLGNKLPPEIFGQYKYIQSLLGIFLAFSLTGLSPAVVRSVARGKKEVFFSAYNQAVKWNIPFLIITIGASIYYFYNKNIDFGLSLLIIALANYLLKIFEVFSATLNGEKNFRLLTLYQFYGNLFGTFTLSSAIFFSQSIFFLITAFFAPRVIISFIGYALTRKRLITQNISPVTTKETQESQDLSFHLTFINGIAAIADKIDGVLVFQFLGATQLAIYNFTTLFPNYFQSVAKKLMSLLIPRFAARDRRDVKSNLLKKETLFFIPLITIFLFYLYSADFLIRFFFPLYQNSIYYSKLYAVTILLSSVVPISFFDSQRRILDKYKLTTYSSVIKILFLVIGVYFFQIPGLIFARIFSKLAGWVLLILFIRKI
ncbi:MAG: hypothetical protein FJY91_00635 [Candidatus Harrisonbacteria bacterium]|nr:hypothetical protein [Candidatus Harrisonbacteria bacterium]